MTTITATHRNVELTDLVQQLSTQRDLRADYVVGAGALEAVGGRIQVSNDNETFEVLPTPVMLGSMAATGRLDVPIKFLREMHNGSDGNQDDPGIRFAELNAFDAIVNARLMRAEDEGKSYLLRTFTDPDGGVGVGRSLLSDKYGIVDNYDVLMSVLVGIRAAGHPVEVTGCDLTETRMRVRINSPAVTYLATEWLKGYRNPFPVSHTGYDAGQEPIVSAGLEVSNSETGGGAFALCPRFTVMICRNGAKITKDAMREVHLGGRLEHGQINFAADTHQKSLELVTCMARDAVSKFLSAEYLEATIRDLEATAAVGVHGSRTDLIARVGVSQRWSEAETASILEYFIAGGQATAGGVMQAATAFAQDVADPERAAELEDRAIDAMTDAARFARVA